MRTKPLLLLFCLIWAATLMAQTPPPEAISTGYFHQNDTTYFVYASPVYQKTPESRVVVTGAFRSWSQDMDDASWQLRPKGDSYWILGHYNPNFESIPPRTPFKFRLNEGEWMDPPATAENAQGGNLLFMHNMSAPTLRVEIQASGNIWAYIDGVERPLSPAGYRLTNAAGDEIPIKEVLPNTMWETLIIPAEPIDKRRVYYLEIKGTHLKSWCNFDGWFRHVYSTKELGANIRPDGRATDFRVFAPRATAIKLYLYDGKNDPQAREEIDMSVDADGVWEATVSSDLKGTWYDFTVHGFDDPGNHFFNTQASHISDPYARVNDDSHGRSRVWPKTTPATPVKGGIPPLESVIAYEVHVQDFTDRLPVSEELKGTLPAMATPGLRNSKGQPVGFDYLVDLGINVVHLMPVQEFLHYPDEDWKSAFKDDPFMIEQGIAEENYQWGYRTTHAFAVETRFRKKDTEPGSEREQFRDLVQAFHDKGIAVIIDIVPNHTGENMDAKPYYFHWNVLDKIYHYRTKDHDHIGEYGNEYKSENRPMNQRWLIDQCQHFIQEFGIDGFRIDLAGQVDRQTLTKLREAVGPEIIIYGEPWIASADPDYEANPSWDWYKHNSPIVFFQDDARNAFTGPVSNPEVKGRDQGYAGGNYKMIEKVKAGLTNTFPDDKTPLSGINYLDIHDNWSLADQFAIDNWDGRMGVDENRYKIAALLLYTSLGPIVTHGGTEMMRSKGMAELKETVKETSSGIKVYLHGKRDTYNMRAANQFVWENVGKTKKDKGSKNDYKNMLAFWQGLNRFRLSEYGTAFRRRDPAPDGYYRWVDTVNPYQLGYIVDDRIFVLINTGGEEHDWDNVTLPNGTWKLIGTEDAFDHVKGVKGPKAHRMLQGGQALNFTLPGPGLRVWVRE
ncbi:MAG: alpha-amylase family glycosyl hydrolase [Bacteroidota bacterium]